MPPHGKDETWPHCLCWIIYFLFSYLHSVVLNMRSLWASGSFNFLDTKNFYFSGKNENNLLVFSSPLTTGVPTHFILSLCDLLYCYLEFQSFKFYELLLLLFLDELETSKYLFYSDLYFVIHLQSVTENILKAFSLLSFIDLKLFLNSSFITNFLQYCKYLNWTLLRSSGHT